MTYFYFAVILCGFGVFGIAIYLASKNGSKSAQLAALKAELRKLAEEEERAKRINNFANGLNSDDARRLLQDVANEQSKRM
jgi:hypothetical protein